MSDYLYHGNILNKNNNLKINEGFLIQKVNGIDYLVILEGSKLFSIFKNKLLIDQDYILTLKINHFKKSFVLDNLDFIIQDYSIYEGEKLCETDLDFNLNDDVICSELKNFINPEKTFTLTDEPFRFCDIKDFLGYDDSVIIQKNISAIVITNIEETTIKLNRTIDYIFMLHNAENFISADYVDFYSDLITDLRELNFKNSVLYSLSFF